jgi:predicted GNAT family acetyltransferase
VLELDDAAEFLHAAGPLMLPNEARDNLIFGIAGSIVSDPGRYPEARFWIVTTGDDPAAAAMRTPPFNLVLAKPRDDDALAALAAGITGELPGIVGGRPEVDLFARLWSERHEVTPRIQRRHGVYALEAVLPLPPASGEARRAAQRDRPLLLEWSHAFGEEVLEEDDPGRIEAVAMVDHRLGAPDGGFLLWEDAGEPVSAAGWGGPTPNGIRIGPVYTPPELRGRGYATALTAELSQQLLDQGRRFCFLFTDLANPTSNHVYQAIGYEPVTDIDVYVFG